MEIPFRQKVHGHVTQQRTCSSETRSVAHRDYSFKCLTKPSGTLVALDTSTFFPVSSLFLFFNQTAPIPCKGGYIFNFLKHMRHSILELISFYLFHQHRLIDSGNNLHDPNKVKRSLKVAALISH